MLSFSPLKCLSSADIHLEVETIYVKASENAKAILVLFPGGNGKIYKDRSKNILSKNFLVRSQSIFSSFGYDTILVGTKKNTRGYSDKYRFSSDHRREVSLLINRYNNGKLPIFFIGTSRGTLSALNMNSLDKTLGVQGIILTSTVVNNHQLKKIGSYKVTAPTLFVHHEKDDCWSSNYEDAKQLSKKLKPQDKITFIKVNGGKSPRSKPCRALSFHGFYGIEAEVIAKIDSWTENLLKLRTKGDI